MYLCSQLSISGRVPIYKLLVIGLMMAAPLGALSAQEPASEFPNQWGNWRGPNYDGSLAESNPPVEWDGQSGKNILWKTAVPGEGKSTPILWEDHVYLLAAIKTDRRPSQVAAGQQSDASPTADQASEERPRGGRGGGRGSGGRGGMNQPTPTQIYQFVVLAYDRSTGKEVWRTVVKEGVPHEGGHTTNSHASASPVTDGEHLFASFGSQGVYCLDMQGNIVWERQLGEMQTRNAFGEGGSPVLSGDSLIVPWDHEGPSSLIALDARNGETRWQTAREEPTTWATPLVIEYGGKRQVVTNGTTVRSYDVETGELLWECGGQVTNPIPTPVRFQDSVICMTGYRGNAIYALPLDARGDLTNTAKILWDRHDAAPYVASPTLYKGRLYFTKSRDGIMSSVDAAKGEVIIPEHRISEIRDVYASPVAAGDRVYFTSREGVTTVVQHADEYQELASNRLGEPVDASPAISGDRLFMRGAEHLFCIGPTTSP
jgi:outer membrane protein assembly factor BamB